MAADLTYSQANAALADIARALNEAYISLIGIQDQAVRVDQIVDGLPSQYQGVNSTIDRIAAENPGDSQWQDLKDRKDKMIPEFQQAKVLTNDMVTLTSTVDVPQPDQPT